MNDNIMGSLFRTAMLFLFIGTALGFIIGLSSGRVQGSVKMFQLVDECWPNKPVQMSDSNIGACWVNGQKVLVMERPNE